MSRAFIYGHGICQVKMVEIMESSSIKIYI